MGSADYSTLVIKIILREALPTLPRLIEMDVKFILPDRLLGLKVVWKIGYDSTATK